ncbi:DUF302 domain-containing protein [Flavobacteriaceae bacterium F89]|uniref:DUF302 domain-containing protein n=1 Tax=Cerina litoralis TaxID=2874477 RepID=A0AAE3EYU3_9FLAO|nr:DUF302 domain-containing protein [Cerina litoralis]MCG2462684.1 DUF302 domain-containing protein [Cerina litoralis]
MKTKKLKFSTLLFSALLVASLFGFTQSSNAQSVKPVTVQSKKDFNGTIDAIKKAVSGGGMMVLAELNQGKVLSMTGLQVNGHAFFVGNPNVGKEAFSADPSVGLVVPVRINVYEKDGKTYVNYFKPSDLFASFNDKKVKMIGDKLDGKLGMMMKMISK